MSYLRRLNPAVTSLRPDCYDEATLAGVAARAGIPLYRDTDEHAAAAIHADTLADARFELSQATARLDGCIRHLALYRDVARSYQRMAHVRPAMRALMARTRTEYAGPLWCEMRAIKAQRARVAVARAAVEALS